MEASQAKEKSEETGIYIVMENNVKSPKEKYKRKAIKILSILHLVSGSLAISAAGFMLIFESGDRRFYAPVGEGLICGFMFLVTGVVGITSIKWTTYCTIIAFLVLNILSALFGFILSMMRDKTLYVFHSSIANTAPRDYLNFSGVLTYVKDVLIFRLHNFQKCRLKCNCIF